MGVHSPLLLNIMVGQSYKAKEINKKNTNGKEVKLALLVQWESNYIEILSHLYQNGQGYEFMINIAKQCSLKCCQRCLTVHIWLEFKTKETTMKINMESAQSIKEQQLYDPAVLYHSGE